MVFAVFLCIGLLCILAMVANLTVTAAPTGILGVHCLEIEKICLYAADAAKVGRKLLLAIDCIDLVEQVSISVTAETRPGYGRCGM